MIRNIKIEDAEAIQRICNISLGYAVSIETVMKQIQKLSENILGLAILPEFQCKGIGRGLMQHLELKAKDDSVLFVRLNSADYRVEAHKFYESIGYVCDKTQKRFIKKLD